MEEGATQSSRILEFHKCIGSLIIILGFCLKLECANASALVTDCSSTILMKLFAIDVSAYFGSLGVMILQTDPDIGELMNKISILFGTLAVTVELLILVPPFGWLALFFWSICFVRIASKSYRYLKTLYARAVSALSLAYGQWKEKMFAMKGNAVLALVQSSNKLKELINTMGSNAVGIPRGAFDQLKELFRSGGPLTDHEAQDQKQNQNWPSG